MTFAIERGAPPAGGRASLAVDRLRAVVILLVVAFHSALAYLSCLPPRPFALASAGMMWRAFPIVDAHRWIGFDLFCAWLDVFLMSFFFMLSGLFAWPSLTRKGAAHFLADRLLRLGLPFAVVVLLLMPATQYPTYLQTAALPTIAGYWRELMALPVWPTGPMWFLWLLLAGDALAAGLYALLAGRREIVLRLSRWAYARPAAFCAGLLLASALAYLPLALLFGTQGWVQRGPFGFQLSRPGHYAVYFSAGVAIGACGIERGLLAADGPLARHWRAWLLAAPGLFLAWCALTGIAMQDGAAAPFGLRVLDDLSFVAACFASCMLAFAAALRFARRRGPVLESLKNNAYGMYLVHYSFVVWLQYALLGLAWPAVAKAALVFAGAVAASWSLSAMLCRVPVVRQAIGGGRRAAARPKAAPPPEIPALARR
jgi:peptidoglycan/LPS O-acetylase OafA/YrhL